MRALFRLSAFFQRKRCPRCFARRPTGTNVGTSPLTSSFAISGQAASVSATLLLSGPSRGLERHAALPNGDLAFFVAFARAQLARSDTDDQLGQRVGCKAKALVQHLAAVEVD